MNIVGSRILIAVQELERWYNRHAALKDECKRLPYRKRQERQAKRRELSRVNEQIAYYRALTRDMKKRMNPPRLRLFLGMLSNY